MQNSYGSSYSSGQPYGDQAAYNYGRPSAPGGYDAYTNSTAPGGYQQGGGWPGPPQQPQPPPGVSMDAWNWFRAIDQDGNGQINVEELQRALTSGNWKPFKMETCKLLLKMYDRDRSGTIGVNEFSGLLKYVNDWKACFERFDNDRSGSIDMNELSQALRTFGYNLSPQFITTAMLRFDPSRKGSILFDDFIQCCVMLHNYTEAFKTHDQAKNGMARFHYEDFLRIILDNSFT